LSVHDIFIAGIETAFNAYLDLDPETATKLGCMSGKVIGIEITDLGFTLFISPVEDKLRVLPKYEGEPEAVVIGSSVALVRPGLGGDPGGLLTKGSVKIRGDMELGKQFFDVLTSIEVDWEEQLSRYVGDISAHQIGNIFRALWVWTRRTQISIKQNFSEYLQEEARIVPTRLEVESFLDDVDTFRSDVDRLQAKLDRLTEYLGQGKQPAKKPIHD
jgi:ubiquinone biosynthesis protein UbiJ